MRTLRTRTLANGGGTFKPRTHADVTRGYAVAVIDGTYAKVPAKDSRSFYRAINRLTDDIDADGRNDINIGTWLDGDTIHIDPAIVVDDESVARDIAKRNNQLAYYIIHEQREVRL